MTPVLFIGGMADGQVVDFPEYTWLSDLYPLSSADGLKTHLYELEIDLLSNPSHIYRYVGGK